MISQKMVENVDKFADGEDLDNSIVIEGSGNEASDKQEECLDKLGEDLKQSEPLDKVEAAQPFDNDA